MAGCPRCSRPIALARTTCVYCGAPLPADVVAAVLEASAPEAPRPGADRTLVVIDVGASDAGAVCRALSLSRYDVRQLAQKSPLHLVRILPSSEAAHEGERLGHHGLAVFLLPEADVRRLTSPRPVHGGRWVDGTLVLRTPRGSVSLMPNDLLLVVQGPIAREYQVPPELAEFSNVRKLRHVRAAVLTQGFRYHLHGRAEPQPLELDPLAFEFPVPQAAGESSEQRLAAWVASLTTGVVVDATFARTTPALAPARETSQGSLSVAGALHRRPPGAKDSSSPILDNLEQFRFFSAWRGVLERQRAGLTAQKRPVLPSGPGS